MASPSSASASTRQRPALGLLSWGAAAVTARTSTGSKRRMTLDSSKQPSPSPSRKRRSQSMTAAELELHQLAANLAQTGAQTAIATTTQMSGSVSQALAEISPRKKQRTSLAPRKSILKPANSTGNIHDYASSGAGAADLTGNFTTTFYAQSQTLFAPAPPAYGSREGSHESEDGGTMNYTRRQSRRVSFAACAQMREFERDNGDDSLSHAGTSPPQPQPAALPAFKLDVQAAIAQAANAPSPANQSQTQSPSPAKNRRRSSAAHSHRRRSSVASAAALVESLTPSPSPVLEQGGFQPAAAPVDSNSSTAMEDPDASSMNIADPDSVTTAFNSHFSFPRMSTTPAGAEEQDSLEDEGEPSGMVLANESESDVTSAFASNTHLFGSSSARSGTAGGDRPPRQSIGFPSQLPPAGADGPAEKRRASVAVGRSPGKAQVSAPAPADRRTSLPASTLFGDIPRAPDFSRSLPATSRPRYSTVVGERSVPLGGPGVDAEESARLRAEKARRGSVAFYASAGAGGASVFAQHHSPHLDQQEEDGQSEMDMSIADTRRESNVFARAFLPHEDEDDEERTPAPAAGVQQKKTGIYPSLSGLGLDVDAPPALEQTRAGRNEGQTALAFLDEEEEEEDERDEVDQWLTGRQEEAAGSPALELQSTGAGAGAGAAIRRQSAFAVLPDAQAALEPEAAADEEAQDNDDAHAHEQAETSPSEQEGSARTVENDHMPQSIEEEEPELEPEVEEPQYQPLPNIFIPRQSRLSTVSERPLEEEEEEIEEEDMDITGVYAPRPSAAQADSAPRRLSVEHPVASAGTSPMKSPRMFQPRRSLAPVSSAQPAMGGTPKSPFRPSRQQQQQQTGSSPVRGLPVAAAAATETGLTPPMRRLSDWSLSASKSGSRPSIARASSAEQPPEQGMSLDQFLQMADMQFMDGLLSVSQAAGGGKGRKSTAAPAPAPGGTEVSLAEQVVASAATIPMMESLHLMMRELRGSLREHSQMMDDLEEAVEDETPELFVEYAAADPEMRTTMDHYFKRVRQFFRQEARREWYEYRTTVFDALCQSYSANLAGLSSDLSIVSSTQETLDSSLPFLRARAAELSAALEKEKARNESLQSADQEHLAELREAIKEQNGAMEDFRRDVKESEEQLARVQDKEDELTTRRKEQEKAIAASRKVLDEVKFYTKGEVCRLQDELDLLQYLHGWQLVRFDSTRIELTHRAELGCTLVMRAGGLVEDFEVVLLDDNPGKKDTLRNSLDRFFFDRLQGHLGAIKKADTTAKDLLRHISSLWSGARKLRSELLLLALRYPLSLSFVSKKSNASTSVAMRASARVFALTAQSEFTVVFEISGEEMLHKGDEGVTANVGVSVEVAYGDVDREELVYIIRERIASSEPRALLEACEEAEAKYT